MDGMDEYATIAALERKVSAQRQVIARFERERAQARHQARVLFLERIIDWFPDDDELRRIAEELLNEET